MMFNKLPELIQKVFIYVNYTEINCFFHIELLIIKMQHGGDTQPPNYIPIVSQGLHQR